MNVVASPVSALVCWILILSASITRVIQGLPREHVLVDSKGFANLAFRARDGQVYLSRFNDFYHSWDTALFDNITTYAIHEELEPGQGVAPSALSDPRVFELQGHQTRMVGFLSQDWRIALFEWVNETKKWKFTQSQQVFAVGNIAGFSDAAEIVHVLHRQQINSLQELRFDLKTSSWLPTRSTSVPGLLNTDFHICKLGSGHVLVLQASGKLFYRAHGVTKGWGDFVWIPTNESLRGSPYCFEGLNGVLRILVPDRSSQVLFMSLREARIAGAATFHTQILQLVAPSSGLASGDAMGYGGLNGSEHVVYRGLDSEAYLATYHANRTWGETLDIRSLGCACFNRLTSDPFGYITGYGHHQIIYRWIDHINMFKNGPDTDAKRRAQDNFKVTFHHGWENMFYQGSFDIQRFAQVPTAVVDIGPKCPMESYNASDSCDCGCFGELGGDPDCLNPAVAKIVCVTRDGSKFTGVRHRCDTDANQCIVTEFPINCTELNRHSGNSSTLCGGCLQHYRGKAGPGLGKCTYGRVSGLRPVPAEKNPLRVIQVRRVPAATFADLDNDGDLDCLVGTGSDTVEYYENIGNATLPAFKHGGTQHFNVTGQRIHPFEHDPYFMGYCPFPSLVDLNGDGLLDVAVASIKPRDTNVLFNVGSSRIALFRKELNLFPNVTGTHLRITFADWDSDGDFDAVLDTRYDGVFALENIGNRTHPQFERYARSRDPLRNVQVRMRTTSQLYDFDKDGLVDLLVSDMTAADLRKILFWRNVGTAKAPEFELAQDSLGPLYGQDKIANSADSFTFANLYGKGDELVVSDAQGGLEVLTRNPPIVPQLSIVLGPASPFDGISTPFSRSAPTLVDIDGDGDQDLFFGDEKGEIYFYRNDGHIGKPFFVKVEGPQNPFHGVVPTSAEEIALGCVDIDEDGDFDCYISTRHSHLISVFDGEIPLFKNQGNRTHPQFMRASRADNPLAEFVLSTSSKYSRYRMHFVDLNGDGRMDVIIGGADHGQNVANGGEGVRFLQNTPSGFEELLGEDNPFGHINDIGTYATFACFDWDFDGDKDCLVVSWEERSFFLLNEGNSSVPHFVLTPNGPLANFKNALTAENLAFADIDDDGLIDVIAGSQPGSIVYFRNTGLDCFSECLGRGFCGQIPVSEEPNSSPVLAAVASFQGVQTHGEAVGKCWCTSEFAGSSCEICSDRFYGVDCSQTCPPFSVNRAKIIYPEASTIQHCECLPTFRKVNRTDRDGFDCVCPPGHEFSEELGVCQQCGAGRFHPHFDLTPCTSCSSLLGPSSTTATSIATAASDCNCASTFTKHRGRCVCTYNRFGPSNGTFCDKCPDSLPFTLEPDAQTEDECSAASGSFEIDNQQVASCNTPEFKDRLNCSAKGITLPTLPLLSGYWRLAATSTQIIPCSPKTRCAPALNQSKSSQGWWSDRYCTPGHTGVQCEGCNDGLTRSQGGCVFCTPEKSRKSWGLSALWIVLTVMLVVLPACFVCWVARMEAAIKKKQRKKREKKTRVGRCYGACARRSSTWKVRASLLIGFFQVYVQFVVITGLLSGEAGEITFIQVVAQFDLSALYVAFDTACALPANFWFRLFTYTLLPLVAVLLMFVILVFKRTARVAGTVCYLTLLVFFFVYPGVSALVFRSFVWNDYFRSPQDANPLQALAADLTILAGSKEATITMVYSGIMVFVYPFCVVLLFYRAVRFHTEHKTSESEFKAEVAKSVAFLVESYTFPWYECYELVRKLILTSGYLLVYNASKDGGTLFYLIFASLFVYANRVISGYRSSIDFRFAEVSHLLIWFLGILPHILKIDRQAAQGLAIATPVVEVFFFLFTVYLPHRSGDTTEARAKPNGGNEDHGPSDSSHEPAGEFLHSNDNQEEKPSRGFGEQSPAGDCERVYYHGGTEAAHDQVLSERLSHGDIGLAEQGAIERSNGGREREHREPEVEEITQQ